MYTFNSEKAYYEIATLEKVIIIKSKIIKDYIATINYPEDWALLRVMQHIIEYDKNHTIV